MPPHTPRSVCGDLYDYRGRLGVGCLAFKDGRIESITEKPRGEHLDLTGTDTIITPGLVDLHVHLRGLELSFKEDEYTGTLQALKAGVTLIADMPNTRPYINTPETLALKLDALKANSWTDYAPYSGIPADPALVDKLSHAPIAGFKAYPEDLGRVDTLRRVTGSGSLLIVHPEYLEGLRLSEVEGNEARGIVRGCSLEALAVEHLGLEGVEGRVHATHASCPQTVSEAKRLHYTVDVTPHHLFYDSSMQGCTGRVNPPLRGVLESSALLQLLLEGRVDALASDHAPHTQAEKSEPLTCSPGFPWLPLWPWLAYSRLVSPGALTLQEFLWYASRSPSLILGLEDYGVIEHGARANVIALNPRERWRFPGFQDSRHRLHVHFMAELVGVPEYVFLGGILSWSYRQGVLERGKPVNPFEASYAVEH